MPQLDVYLTFNGNCADAMRFYERTLNGKLEMLMTHAESPMAAQAPPGSANRIMHARLVIDGRVLMASDSMVGQPYEGMKGFSLSLNLPDGRRRAAGVRRLGQGRPSAHAIAENVLGRSLRHAGRPLRHTLDDQRWHGEQLILANGVLREQLTEQSEYRPLRSTPAQLRRPTRFGRLCRRNSRPCKARMPSYQRLLTGHIQSRARSRPRCSAAG
jgi:uncharacterized glyoxalase superfamily protein PhnB